MTRSKLSTKVVLLATSIGLSMAAFAGAQPATAQSYSDEYTCPAGTVYDPTYGCTVAGGDDYAYYGYPYGGYGLYGQHRKLGHDFAHSMGTSVNHGASVTVLRGSPSRGLGGDGFNHATAGGISNVDHGSAFAHFGGRGFGHGIGAEGTIVHHGMGFHSIGVAHFGGVGFAHGIGGGFHGGGFGGGGHR